MELVTAWVKGVIALVLFASFLELLLPNSGMQKFVRVIVGLMILLAIVGPAVDLIQERLAPADLPAWSATAAEAEPAARTDGGELIRQTYQKELARQMQAVVNGIEGVSASRVAVEVAAGAPGAIEKITVYIKPSVAEPAAVKKIAIGREAEAAPEPEPTVKNKVVDALCTFYQVKRRAVAIKWLH